MSVGIKNMEQKSIDKVTEDLTQIDKAEFMINLLYLKYHDSTVNAATLIEEELKIYHRNGYKAKYYITKEGILTYQVHKPQIGYKYKGMNHNETKEKR